jgi:hypothetical protein
LRRTSPRFSRSTFLGPTVVIGEGPARDELARICPKTIFLGAKHGEDLARACAAADVEPLFRLRNGS